MTLTKGQHVLTETTCEHVLRDGTVFLTAGSRYLCDWPLDDATIERCAKALYAAFWNRPIVHWTSAAESTRLLCRTAIRAAVEALVEDQS